MGNCHGTWNMTFTTKVVHVTAHIFLSKAEGEHQGLHDLGEDECTWAARL